MSGGRLILVDLQHLKEHAEEMEDEGNILRRSVNDITTLLDINFGSLGRPSRGGRGRGARGGLSSLPERAKPTPEKVSIHVALRVSKRFAFCKRRLITVLLNSQEKKRSKLLAPYIPQIQGKDIC